MRCIGVFPLCWLCLNEAACKPYVEMCKSGAGTARAVGDVYIWVFG